MFIKYYYNEWLYLYWVLLFTEDNSKSLSQLINDICSWYIITVIIIIRTKCNIYSSDIEELRDNYISFNLSRTPIIMKSKIVTCKRLQLLLIEACVVTIHKSRGGTYDKAVHDYYWSCEQQLVYW